MVLPREGLQAVWDSALMLGYLRARHPLPGRPWLIGAGGAAVAVCECHPLPAPPGAIARAHGTTAQRFGPTPIPFPCRVLALNELTLVVCSATLSSTTHRRVELAPTCGSRLRGSSSNQLGPPGRFGRVPRARGAAWARAESRARRGAGEGPSDEKLGAASTRGRRP